MVVTVNHVEVNHMAVDEELMKYMYALWEGSGLLGLFVVVEVMLEKQLTRHRVDRSICAWFWEQAISQGDSFKSRASHPLTVCLNVSERLFHFLTESTVGFSSAVHFIDKGGDK
ncbi:AP-3 complex subunit mu [Camellia lanceoleosa]|uniref:AP-3 complex subunit mu n=1 Tax=Camellia lanceoleosa TaxID=1840588 RepID=A0ACC0H025_9ERIC|nr:AP-3 complex subunit mu [Camellia lanceoleosa]